MSSYMAKPEEIKRKWYIIDAANKPLGRVAQAAASILRGKHLPTFTPHVDCGDHVIIINAKDAVLTGNKLSQKIRYYHTGWVGGIKEIH
ncbi:MAG: 50S ribosomal protein L13, partial [Clostridia bacterium]|nr:50S ribosomal protein L13 [Clostridia bacterium]